MLTHDELIQYMHQLGYKSNEAGICYGLACMGMQAILTNDLTSFEKRLDTIKADLTNHLRLAQLIHQDSITPTDDITQEDINTLTDIRAFLDGIELYFQPQIYSSLFEAGKIPVTQDAFMTAPVISSAQIEEQGGIHEASFFCGVYNTDELSASFESLYRLIKINNESIAFLLSSGSHAICIGLNPNEHDAKWAVIDANNLPPKYVNTEELVQLIMRYMFAQDHTLLAIHPYSTTNNKRIVDDIINKWKLESQWNQMQKITNEKASFISPESITLLHFAASFDDIRTISDLLEYDKVDINLQNNFG